MKKENKQGRLNHRKMRPGFEIKVDQIFEPIISNIRENERTGIMARKQINIIHVNVTFLHNSNDSF